MRIVVLVKQVPDTYEARRLDARGRIVRGRGPQVVDEVTERALEFALHHRDSTRSGEVTAVTMGPPSARDAVRHALAMGADRGLHLCDERLAGADIIQTAVALSSLLRGQTWDLVVTGRTSSDGGGGVVPALLSQLLCVPLLSDLVEVRMGVGEITGCRVTDAGIVSVRAPLPSIVSVTDQLPEPRLPKLRDVLAAKRKPLTTLSLNDAGIASTGPTTAIMSAEERPRRTGGAPIRDDGTAAAQLAGFLADRRLI